MRKSEVFDYENMLIRYNGRSYPFVIILEGDIEHIVSVADLDSRLYDDEKGEYPSRLAEWIDEQITYFVATTKDLLRPAENILKEIYG